ncbi:hypothetical protein BH23CHL5_BH23CHL5_14510 [soil metagenome]
MTVDHVGNRESRDRSLGISRRGLIKTTAASAVSFAAAPAYPRDKASGQESESIAQGMALVSSPRLPLTAVDGSAPARIFAAEVTDWQDLGAPFSLPVELLALEGMTPPGAIAVETFSTYNDIADQLWNRAGAVAVVPVSDLDFRANVLAVDGIDPLRHGQAEDIVRISFVGDIVPGRNVHLKMTEYADFTHPFRKVANELSSYDVAIANLEGNLSSNIPAPSDPHTFSFVSSPAMIDGMKMAGIDAVSLANNHARWNSEGWGASALLDTIDSLDQAGMGWFGAGRDLDQARAPFVAEVGSTRIAVIGIDGVTANERPRPDNATVWLSAMGESEYAGATASAPGTNPYVLSAVLADIEFLAGMYDVVIPYFHMGVEYSETASDWVVAGAKAAIDVGATMVVTNHPHVIQGMGVYSGKPIVYSVGNFIFDQMFSVNVRQGLILELVMRGNRVAGLRLKGVEIEDFNQPRLMSVGEQAAIMDRFWASTDRLVALGY